MQQLVLTMFAVVFTLDYVALRIGSGEITLLAEVLSLIATFAFVGYICRDRSLALSVKYVVFFSIVVLHLVNGVIINATPSGAVVSGIRVYFKYLPFFLLPFVYSFSERQITGQLRFLLFLCLLQLPAALIQRFFLFSGGTSGDVVTGTMATSSFLSIVLICAIAVVMAFYQKRLISLRQFLGLLLLLFIPTTINETKGTLILLPIALFVPLLFAESSQFKRKQAWTLVMISCLMVGGYVTVYNAFYGERFAEEEDANGSIVSFFTDPTSVIRYLAPRTSGIIVKEGAEAGPVGRVDRLVLAYQYLAKDPVQLFVGLGIGRVSESPIEALSADMDALSADVGAWSGDELGWQSKAYGGVGLAHVLWELGMFGLLLLYTSLYLAFRDARALSRRDDMDGALGLAWCAVVPIIAISYFYKDILPVHGIMFSFWYLTGYVIAQRFRHGWRPTPTRQVVRRRTQWTPASAGSSRTFRDLAPRLKGSRP